MESSAATPPAPVSGRSAWEAAAAGSPRPSAGKGAHPQQWGSLSQGPRGPPGRAWPGATSLGQGRVPMGLRPGTPSSPFLVAGKWGRGHCRGPGEHLAGRPASSPEVRTETRLQRAREPCASARRPLVRPEPEAHLQAQRAMALVPAASPRHTRPPSLGAGGGEWEWKVAANQMRKRMRQ